MGRAFSPQRQILCADSKTALSLGSRLRDAYLFCSARRCSWASVRTPANSPDVGDQMLERSRSSVASTPRRSDTEG